MKKTIIFASVALATLFAFSSCQKESLENNYSENSVRVITATFENNGTKTTLSPEDNKTTPLWKEGDIIRVFGTRASGNQYDDITLSTDNIRNGGKSINFTTTLSGILYAVYPASATAMTSCTDGNITFTIPTVQDGTFASANICVAKSTAIDGTNKDNLVFSNATSVLEFSQTAASTGVLRVAVTAANAIAGKLTASFGTDNKATISPTDGLTGKIIYTTAAATAQDKYYVAVAPVETGDITFNYYKAEEEKSESKITKTLALNKIYALTIPTATYEKSYVEITMTVGSDTKNYKWAKCNIGATKETDYGDYYAWGDITGQAAATSKTGAFATEFSWDNCPFNNGSSSCDGTYFSGVKETVCPDGVLAKDYDVAHKVLGGNWRMPTKAEFDALCSLTKEWKTNYKSSGVKGYLFTDANDNSIFLPAAGCGYGTDLFNAGDYGRYWSSSLNTDLPNDAYYLCFYGGYADTFYSIRYYGLSVHALSE